MKSLSVSFDRAAWFRCYVYTQRRQLEKADVALVYRFFLQHLARNLPKTHVDPGVSRHLASQLVEFKDEVPAEDVRSGLLRRVVARPDPVPRLGRYRLYVRDGYGRVYCPDMHHPAQFDAVQPRPGADRVGVVEVEDKVAIPGFTYLGVFGRGELDLLPRLPLVLTQVLHHERFDVGDAQEAFTGSVNGKAPQVAGNPAAALLFSDGGGGTGTAEAIEHEVAFVGGSFDDALEQSFGFLGGIAYSFISKVMNFSNAVPDSLRW